MGFIYILDSSLAFDQVCLILAQSVVQKNRGEELRKISFGWPGNESSGWAKNRAVINRPKSLHLILRHKKIHSDLSYTLKAWLIIFIKF